MLERFTRFFFFFPKVDVKDISIKEESLNLQIRQMGRRLSPASKLYLPVLKATRDVPHAMAPDISLVQTV